MPVAQAAASLAAPVATQAPDAIGAGGVASQNPVGNVFFAPIVDRLQALGYLPLVRASLYQQVTAQGDSVRVRHDAFAFAVPKTLQIVADSYAWDTHNPFIRGALIAFNRANGRLHARQYAQVHFDADALQALQSAQARPAPWPWTWVLVDKRTGTLRNETLQVWRAPQGGDPGGFVFATPVSTGVLDATTDGTWPIHQRLPSTTMKGQFPHPISMAQYKQATAMPIPSATPGNAAAGATPIALASPGAVAASSGAATAAPPVGLFRGHPVRWVPYNDPGILWVSYFHSGRALHFYPRARYGFEQSAGCVEEPLPASKTVYGLVHYGVAVSVLDHEAPGDVPDDSVLIPASRRRHARRVLHPTSRHARHPAPVAQTTASSGSASAATAQTTGMTVRND